MKSFTSTLSNLQHDIPGGMFEVNYSENRAPVTFRGVLRTWKYTLGSFSDDKTEKYDNHVVVLRTIILLTYLVTNCFIVSGVIRHWNSNQCQDRFSNDNSKYKGRRISKTLLLTLELNDAMEHLGWDLSKVEYEVVTHHDVPNRDDGYIVIRKTNPDTWYVNNKDKYNAEHNSL